MCIRDRPLGGAQGQATEIQIAAEHILKTKKKLNQILADNAGKPVEEVEKDTDRDNWLSADEAKEYGLIDEVIKMCIRDRCSVALYGHTHVPDVSYCKDVLVMNPGSISRPRQASGRPTYGIVTIGSNGEARADTYSL